MDSPNWGKERLFSSGTRSNLDEPSAKTYSALNSKVCPNENNINKLPERNTLRTAFFHMDVNLQAVDEQDYETIDVCTTFNRKCYQNGASRFVLPMLPNVPNVAQVASLPICGKT